MEPKTILIRSFAHPQLSLYAFIDEKTGRTYAYGVKRLKAIYKKGTEIIEDYTITNKHYILRQDHLVKQDVLDTISALNVFYKNLTKSRTRLRSNKVKIGMTTSTHFGGNLKKTRKWCYTVSSPGLSKLSYKV